jgi:hypothetical protein
VLLGVRTEEGELQCGCPHTGIAVEKSAFNRKTLFNRKLDFNLRKKPIKCCIGTHLPGAETWTLWKDQKYLKNFEVWCWRKVISSTSLVVYKILRRLTEEKITLHTIKRTGSRRWMTRKKTSRYWMIFRPGEGAGNWRRKHRAALCGELELGEAVDLLQVRSWIGWILMNVA